MIPLVSMTLLGGYLKRVKKKVIFRVDASFQIGTGHFMRCLTLATELIKNGMRTYFISRHLPEYLRDMLANKGIEFTPIDSVQTKGNLDDLAHSKWLGTSQVEDAQTTIQALPGGILDWLIVDHYSLDVRWESILRKSAKKILVIDDIADRLHDCDVLLDQNLYVDMNIRYKDKVPSHCQLLMGPRYALLRDEFRLLREKIKPRSGPVKRVLVFFGGVDAYNFTDHTIEALSKIKFSKISVDVVIGAQHPYREQIESACVRCGFACHVQTSHMPELMAAADLGIGAGGSASWERCCMGLPSLLVSLANNQVEIAKALDLFGACVYLGSSERASMIVIHNAILELLNNQDQLSALSEKAYALVDGLGLGRVCQILRC